jgi:DNA-binding transcriptional MocR family regulator
VDVAGRGEAAHRPRLVGAGPRQQQGATAPVETEPLLVLGAADDSDRAPGRRSATRVAFSPQATGVTSPKPTRAARMEIDFAPGRPDLNSFPARDWLWACGEATPTASARDMGYGDPQGSCNVFAERSQARTTW